MFFAHLFRLPGRLSRRLSIAALFAVVPFLAHGFSIAAPSFDELVDEAADIVRGEVIAVESFHTTSANGTPVIKTRVSWRVARSLKGTIEETLTLDFLGGRVGAESLSVSGMPEFKVGEEDFLFVEGNRRVICPLIAAGHGRYSVQADEATGQRIVQRENGRPLTNVRDVSAPLDHTQADAPPAEALTPETFEREIESTLDRLHGTRGVR